MGDDLGTDGVRLPRRTFLRYAVGAGAAAGATAAITPANAAPAGPDWAALRTRQDSVVTASDGARFSEATAVFNTRYDSTVPAAVVRPRTTGEVARAVSFASRRRIPVSARGGGHSYIGASAADGALVIDMRSLSSPIAYDETTQTVSVTPATTLFDLQTFLHRSGRALPVGTCPTVGIGGLTLGGGIGVDTREHGVTCDRLVAATVVLPDGRIVSVSRQRHADLLWALRGGGGGSVGLVTSMTFRTHAATGKDLVLLGFAEEETADVIAAWASWLPTVEPTAWVGVNVESDRAGGLRCGVLIAAPTGAGPDLAARFAAAVGVTPISTAAETLDADGVLLRLAGGSPTTPRHGFTAGSDVVATIPAATARAIVAVVRSRSASGAAGSVIIDPIDGAVGSVRPGASAFPWRRHLAIVQWFVDVAPGGSYESATSWIADAHEAVRPASAGAYVNYVEPGDEPSRYFGANLPRLRATRAFYDPTRVVRSSTEAGTVSASPPGA
ncbi:FAD-binding oxidoreductase [Williamsia phyllosphaerae]|uniref:Oxidoreductase n=1 Tax=Williamsia phyllosphaerae TaxID=885042 RepID=A0ABQ1VA26_9NOCA|nr:FAD-binding oxidoreductase [Williamsia phyllosphaerae]GGF43067.1 oxidoreductase [Williamsia phyllosphaerae]